MNERTEREEMGILNMRIKMHKDNEFVQKFAKPIDPDLKTIIFVLQQDCDELENRCEDLEEQIKTERWIAGFVVVAIAVLCSTLSAIFL